jgi:hypothetical protein
MPYVAAAAAIMGAVVAAKGAKEQAKGQARAARFNAAVQERNAEVADIGAKHKALVDAVEARTQVSRFRELQSGVNVAFTKSGVMPGTGTARLVALDNAAEFDEEMAARKMATMSAVQAMNEKGVNARMEGELQKIYARNYIVAGKYKSQALLLQGASQAASMMATA